MHAVNIHIRLIVCPFGSVSAWHRTFDHRRAQYVRGVCFDSRCFCVIARPQTSSVEHAGNALQRHRYTYTLPRLLHSSLWRSQAVAKAKSAQGLMKRAHRNKLAQSGQRGCGLANRLFLPCRRPHSLTQACRSEFGPCARRRTCFCESRAGVVPASLKKASSNSKGLHRPGPNSNL